MSEHSPHESATMHNKHSLSSHCDAPIPEKRVRFTTPETSEAEATQPSEKSPIEAFSAMQDEINKMKRDNGYGKIFIALLCFVVIITSYRHVENANKSDIAMPRFLWTFLVILILALVQLLAREFLEQQKSDEKWVTFVEKRDRKWIELFAERGRVWMKSSESAYEKGLKDGSDSIRKQSEDKEEHHGEFLEFLDKETRAAYEDGLQHGFEDALEQAQADNTQRKRPMVDGTTQTDCIFQKGENSFLDKGSYGLTLLD